MAGAIAPPSCNQRNCSIKIQLNQTEEKKKNGMHVFVTLRPVFLCTTGTLSSPVRELTSSLVGSLQRCLLCFGRSKKLCNMLTF